MTTAYFTLVILLVSSSARLVTSTISSQLYALVSDGQCLFLNASLSTTVVQNELHCSALCTANSSCSMYMYVSSSQVCALYAGMRPSVYVQKSFSSPGTCRIFNSGWAPCPDTSYVLDGKHYYLYPSKTNFSSALSLCSSQNMKLFKIDNVVEVSYVFNVIDPASSGSANVWLGLYGHISGYSSSNTLVWLSDNNSTLVQTEYPQSVWSTDNCCGVDINCWIIYNDGKVEDNSCQYGTYAGRPLCTCE